ncbi:MAG: phosphatidylinositol mannoside acyltransferase [Acidimicrobiales bacterium]|nr:phosphatidylinositol mannoside acyltransferase [Acidimicrobiales bacterium]MDP6284917.1 phosphatidylinositol mannoside acyltransferase [Acidimicrobiales bacterium]HJO41556.1 phosphatidylinositol mannoside acyltransferase [Acidimicrobiales bacterium]
MASLALIGYKLAALLSRKLPRKLGLGVASFLGYVIARIDKKRRDQVIRNANRLNDSELSRKELKDFIDQTFKSYAHYWVNTFRLVDMTKQELESTFSHDGWELIETALKKDSGVILVLPHLGAWDWGGLWISKIKGVSVSAVVEPLEPPELFEWFKRSRNALGMNIIPLGSDAGPQVLKAISDKQLVVLVSDRDIGGSSVEVEFFGEKTLLPAGPATLALRTGATLLTAAIYNKGNGCHGVVRPAISLERKGKFRSDVKRITQTIADEMELLIRKAPEQWHLMQPNWPSDSQPEKGRI